MHPYDIYLAMEKLFQINFHTSAVKQVRHHLYTDVHIAVFALFVASQRAEEHHGMNTIMLIKIMTSGLQLFYCLCPVKHVR